MGSEMTNHPHKKWKTFIQDHTYVLLLLHNVSTYFIPRVSKTGMTHSYTNTDTRSSDKTLGLSRSVEKFFFYDKLFEGAATLHPGEF